MIKLHNKDTKEPIGEITEAQLQFLIDELVEEHNDDTDYYINHTQLDLFEEKNADPELVSLLRSALGNEEDMEIVWSK